MTAERETISENSCPMREKRRTMTNWAMPMVKAKTKIGIEILAELLTLTAVIKALTADGPGDDSRGPGALAGVWELDKGKIAHW